MESGEGVCNSPTINRGVSVDTEEGAAASCACVSVEPGRTQAPDAVPPRLATAVASASASHHPAPPSSHSRPPRSWGSSRVITTGRSEPANTTAPTPARPPGTAGDAAPIRAAAVPTCRNKFGLLMTPNAQRILDKVRSKRQGTDLATPAAQRHRTTDTDGAEQVATPSAAM